MKPVLRLAARVAHSTPRKKMAVKRHMKSDPFLPPSVGAKRAYLLLYCTGLTYCIGCGMTTTPRATWPILLGEPLTAVRAPELGSIM
jgi:hypothetical protein